MTKRPVPMPTLGEPQSREQLQLLLERVLYTLHWVADNPAHLIDGRHRQLASDALEDLTAQMNLKAGLLTQPDATSPGTTLAGHGLTGRQLALKLQVFDQEFQAFLDLAASLEDRHKAVDVRLTELEVAEFSKNVRQLGSVAMGTIEAGNGVLESVAQVIPHATEILGAVKEVGGALSAAIAWKQSRSA